ncbi:hypothetical protein KKA95_02940 [Patescibacteria group bacterium]|nr:hypothetical protein [Patescibacteria group bacterium]
MNKFEGGDRVRSNTNDQWSGIMTITSVEFSDVALCKHPTLGIGAFKNSAGPANWNQQQGFYIYRSNRMIQSGGWCGLRTNDEHTKLCRIELSFSPKFDSAFKINVAKMTVQLPAQIRELINDTISPLIKLAREYYDGKKKSSSKTFTPQSYSSSFGNEIKPKSSAVNLKDSEFSGFGGTSDDQTDKKLFTLDEIEEKAHDLATEKEKPIVSQIFHRLRKSLFGGL